MPGTSGMAIVPGWGVGDCNRSIAASAIATISSESFSPSAWKAACATNRSRRLRMMDSASLIGRPQDRRDVVHILAAQQLAGFLQRLGWRIPRHKAVGIHQAVILHACRVQFLLLSIVFTVHPLDDQVCRLRIEVARLGVLVSRFRPGPASLCDDRVDSGCSGNERNEHSQKTVIHSVPSTPLGAGPHSPAALAG